MKKLLEAVISDIREALGDRKPSDGDGKIKDKHGSEYEVRHKSSKWDSGTTHHYTVHHKGEEVARIKMKEGRTNASMTEVHEKHRRKGLMTALMNHVERHQKIKFKPSSSVTSDAEAYWKHRSGS